MTHQHQDQPRRAHRLLAQPSFSHFDPLPGSARQGNSAFNTGFREWLKRITSSEHGSMQVACEHIRLEQLKRLLGSIFGAHMAGMSRRDLRLYLKVISASQLSTIRDMRFECFDMMCRKISEPVAVQKLREMDALLR